MVITSARPRAFEQLGLTPEALFARNPRLTWVAITGYGWWGDGADRVAFGDDAAAAGGLVRRTARGEPRFLGDALADPLTGLAAAAGALGTVGRGGGFLVRCGAGGTRTAAERRCASAAPSEARPDGRQAISSILRNAVEIAGRFLAGTGPDRGRTHRRDRLGSERPGEGLELDARGAARDLRPDRSSHPP